MQNRKCTDSSCIIQLNLLNLHFKNRELVYELQFTKNSRRVRTRLYKNYNRKAPRVNIRGMLFEYFHLNKKKSLTISNRKE